MQLQLTEILIDAALYKLRQGLAARVEAINVEKADDLALSTPGDQDFYAFGSTEIIAVPAVIVTEGPVGAGDVTEEGAHSLSFRDQLLVVVVEEDFDREKLGRRLLRLRRAVIETLWDDEPKARLLDPYGGGASACYSLEVEGWRPGRAFEADREEGQPSVFRSIDMTFLRAWRVEE